MWPSRPPSALPPVDSINRAEDTVHSTALPFSLSTDLSDPLYGQLGSLMPSWVDRWCIQQTDESVILFLVPAWEVRSEDFRQLRENLALICAPREARLRRCSALRVTDGEGAPSTEPGDDELPSGAHFEVTPYVRARTARNSSSRQQSPSAPPRLSREELFREVRNTLPLGIEPLRLLKYAAPMKGGRLDILVLKSSVPDDKEGALHRWRESFEELTGTTVFVNRVRGAENMRSQIRNLAQNSRLLGIEHLPKVEAVLDNLCGAPPPPIDRVPRPHALVDFTHLSFLAIDSPYVRDREDALFAERLPSGHIRLYVAFVDVTHIVTPGSKIDRYAQRVGASVYGRRRQIPTLGPELAHGEASFLAGKVRPAWVLELVVSPSGQFENANRPILHRALIAVREYMDPGAPDLPLILAEHPVVEALADATNALHAHRIQKNRVFRLDGEGIGHTIVAETMIAAKSAFATYMSQREIQPIYRVHSPPSDEAKRSLVQQLDRLKIPASSADLDSPIEVTGILRCLENLGSRDGFELASQMLDIFFLKSHFSLTNLGHYALGIPDGPGGYVEIKPRDSSGLTNQFQLDHFFRSGTPLSAEDLRTRTTARNLKTWSRDDTIYKLNFFEMLSHRLSLVGQDFSARFVELNDSTAMVEVAEFSRWGLVPRELIPPSASLGGEIAARLRGFNVDAMRFEFAPAPAP